MGGFEYPGNISWWVRCEKVFGSFREGVVELTTISRSVHQCLFGVDDASEIERQEMTSEEAIDRLRENVAWFGSSHEGSSPRAYLLREEEEDVLYKTSGNFQFGWRLVADNQYTFLFEGRVKNGELLLSALAAEWEVVPIPAERW